MRSKTRARLACQQDPLWRIHGRNNNPEPPATLPPGASTAGVAAQRRNKEMQIPAKKEQKESVQKKHLMLLWRPRDYQWCPSFRPPRLPRGNKKMKMEASSDRGATRMKRTHVVHPPGTSPCMTLLDSCLHEENWSRHSCHRRWTACGSSWWNALGRPSGRKAIVGSILVVCALKKGGDENTKEGKKRAPMDTDSEDSWTPGSGHIQQRGAHAALRLSFPLAILQKEKEKGERRKEHPSRQCSPSQDPHKPGIFTSTNTKSGTQTLTTPKTQ